MSRETTQREHTQKDLQNESGRVAGERQFVAAEVAMEAFAEAPAVCGERFRRDVDGVVEQAVGSDCVG